MTQHYRGGDVRLEVKDDSAAGNPAVKEALASIQSIAGEFKSVQDKIHSLEEKAKAVDPLLTEKVDRLSQALDATKDAINKELASLKRPAIGGDEKSAAAAVEFKNLQAKYQGEKYRGSDLDRLEGGDLVEAKAAYDKAMLHYIRTGRELKELSVGTATEGGFLVQPERVNRVITKVFETSPIRQIASVMTVGTNRVELPIDRDEADQGGWVGEQSTRSTSGTPEIGVLEIDVHEQYAMPVITQNMLDDSSIDIAAWLDGKVADKLARSENYAFVTGDGVAKPQGFLGGPTPVTTTDATRAFGTLQYVASGGASDFAASAPADYILDLIYSLKNAYRQGSVFVMSRATMGKIRKMKDGQNNYLVGLRMADGFMVENIFGFPVVEAEDMPAVGADAYAVAFGNFREGYMIVDRQGLRQLRDPYSTKGKVQFYTTKRVGGAIVNSDAIKLMKIASS